MTRKRKLAAFTAVFCLLAIVEIWLMHTTIVINLVGPKLERRINPLIGKEFPIPAPATSHVKRAQSQIWKMGIRDNAVIMLAEIEGLTHDDKKFSMTAGALTEAVAYGKTVYFMPTSITVLKFAFVEDDETGLTLNFFRRLPLTESDSKGIRQAPPEDWMVPLAMTGMSAILTQHPFFQLTKEIKGIELNSSFKSMTVKKRSRYSHIQCVGDICGSDRRPDSLGRRLSYPSLDHLRQETFQPLY